MSFAFLRRAFGKKRSQEDEKHEKFLKNFHVDSFFNANQLSKSFRRNALRLIVLRNPPEVVYFDSSLNKDQTNVLKFVKGDKSVTLTDVVFGSCPLSKHRDLKFSTKLHDFKSSDQIVITNVHTPTLRRVRCTNSASYPSRTQEFIPCGSRNVDNMYIQNEKTIAVCLVINLKWIHSLTKSYLTIKSSSLSNTSSNIDNLTKCLMKRFHYMIFEHFLQISVKFKSLSMEIVRAIHSAESSLGNAIHKHTVECHNDTHESINKAFANFQNIFRDLCLPRLFRPIWNTLSAAAEQANISVYEPDHLNINSWMSQSSILTNDQLDYPTMPTHFDNLTDSFVQGCLCPQISKAIAKDKGYFLGQLLTGLLTYNHGWISTVLPKEQHAENVFINCRNQCEAMALHTSEKYRRLISSKTNEPPCNLLLEQLLTQFGCTLHKHYCDYGPILNNTANVYSTTVLFGQQRDRILSLLYICTYFLRSPNLLKSKERVPDIGRADLFELKQQKRYMEQKFNNNRRKSTSLFVSTTGTALNKLTRGYTSSDPQDSGISSQEDLTAAIFSARSGSCPSHPPGIALCFPQRLTHDQCRYAQVAAHITVKREAQQIVSTSKQAAYNQNMFCLPERTFQVSSKGHTWSASNNLCSPYVNGMFTKGAAALSPVGSSVANMSRKPHLTEIPLIIEKSFDNSVESCWCLGSNNQITNTDTCSQTMLFPTNSFVSTQDTYNDHLSDKFTISSHHMSNHPVPATTKTTETTSYIPVNGPIVTSAPSSYSSNTFEIPSVEVDLSSEFEMGTACSASMEQSWSQDFEQLFHCQTSLGVMEHYNSTLALQATLESVETFKSRLHTDLCSWLHVAPSLLDQELNVNSTIPHSPVFDVKKDRCNYNDNQSFSSDTSLSSASTSVVNYSSNALLINVDASTVKVFTIKRRSAVLKTEQTDQFPNQLNRNMMVTCIPARKSENTLLSDCQKISTTGRNFITPSQRSNHDQTTSDPFTKSMVNIEPAPSILRLLETVKLLSDRSACSSIILRYIESCLQMFCTRSSVLSDLIINEGVDLFKKPERMIAALGCPRGDLPILLSITRWHSCEAAAIMQLSELDF